MTPQNYIEVIESESESESVSEPSDYDSDDSQEDPNFDILEETRSSFSNLSVKKKPRSRVPVEVEVELGQDEDEDEDEDDDVDCTEIAVPKFDANDEKSYEIVHKIIEGGQVERLKVDQCKLYLRKHGLRLTGKKDVLIQRIKEHISIMNGEGEQKYPPSSFVMNCKGDACTGDIVMFEQNVYEMFNIASRSATGPPCGTRVVAGRIVKESYGAAKQQHTFTIEVLWSKGVKPLPPLHPLLIKGRNLYRLNTMRQRWEDESQRQKILSEKHARGNAARTNREARLHEKEMKKTRREHRASKGNNQTETQKMKRNMSPTPPLTNSCNPGFQNTSIQHEAVNFPSVSDPRAGAPYKGNINYSFQQCNNNGHLPYVGVLGYQPSMGMIHNHHGASYIGNTNSNILRGPVRGEPIRKPVQVEQNTGFCPSRPYQNQSQSSSFQQGYLPGSRYQGQRQQLCKYYAQGRCHYGSNCKYLH